VALRKGIHMSAEKQREFDIAFLRKLAAESQAGSMMVAIAMAADKLKEEPLVSVKPAATPLRDLRPKAKTKAKSKPKDDRAAKAEAEEKCDLKEESEKSFEL
jgi:hypothetical protein